MILLANKAAKRFKTNVVIVGAARTPVGSYLGGLSDVSATELGSIAIKGALKQAGIGAQEIQECLMGNVIGANLGQAPTRQAALGAGLSVNTACTGINKVCASGMKAVALGVQSIQLKMHEFVVAGGMESMSRAPFYLDGSRSRKGGFGLGDQTLVDAVIKDGLWDPKHQIHMGMCAEETAEKYHITRQDQDEYARMSYERATQAAQAGKFSNEIVPVGLRDRHGNDSKLLTEDEEYLKIDFEKMSKLKPAFKKEGGTVTAANSSTLSDGASAVVLVEESVSRSRGLRPLARILSYADAECAPKDFPISPSLAIPLALHRAGLSSSDIALYEINEAFAVVVLANEQILNLPKERVNIAGGGVSLGHPIGSSGCRILVTLTHLLKRGEIGCAAICNGGGGATAMVIEKL